MYSKYIVICTNNDYSNYGNRLQNYALSQMMKQYGMPVTTVRAHVHWLTIPDMIWGRLKEFVRPFKRTLLSLTDINQRRISHCEHFTTTMVPDDIISISPATKNRIDSSMLCVVVLGSDQIWNYHWQSSEGLELYLGSFAPRSVTLPASAYLKSRMSVFAICSANICRVFPPFLCVKTVAGSLSKSCLGKRRL